MTTISAVLMCFSGSNVRFKIFWVAFWLLRLPSATKNRAFQGSGVKAPSFDAAKLLTNWLAPALPIPATKGQTIHTSPSLSKPSISLLNPNPFVKKIHLFFCMKPVFTALHYSKVCAMFFCKILHRFKGS